MKLTNLTLNRKLGIIAIVLGFIAVLMPDPLDSKDAVVDMKSLSSKMDDKEIKYSVELLADNMIQSKADFMLVDLSDEQKYAEYHIPLALNLKMQELNTDNLPRNQKIILYSDDNIKTAQAWFLLKANKYPAVYILDGGMKQWKDNILFPSIPEARNAEEKAKYNKLAEVSKFFGGQPRIAGLDTAASAQTIAMPKPTMSSGQIKIQKKKPRKEGC